MFDATTMTPAQIVAGLIEEFKSSLAYKDMVQGKAYYDNDNDIRRRVIYRYENDVKVPDDDATNNRISHPFMKNAVDEKVSYLLGNPVTFNTDEEGEEQPLQEIVNRVLDEDFDDALIDYAREASNGGIAWLHGFIDTDEAGEPILQWEPIECDQVIPLWSDAAHRKLEAIVRFYYVEEYVGEEKKLVMRAELWDRMTVQHFIEYDGALVEDVEKNPDGPVGHYAKVEGETSEEYGWGIVPFIPLRNNSKERPDLRSVKPIVDAYDKVVSNNDNMLEEVQAFVYVLKNYPGTSLTEFVTNLRRYRAIKVDEDGGVDKVQADLTPEAVEAHLDRLKSDFYQFGQSVDMGIDKMGAAPSGVALEFLYSGLKLKASDLERKLRRSLKQVLYMVGQFLEITGQGKYDMSRVDITFTRSTITNSLETAQTLVELDATHSRRTVLANSPYVDDVEEELGYIDEEGSVDSLSFNFEPGDNTDSRVDDE